MFFLYFLIFSMPFFRHAVINAGSGILTVPKLAGAFGLFFALVHIGQHGFPNFFATRPAKLFLAIFTWALLSFARQGRPPRVDVGDPSLLYVSLFVFFVLIVTLVDTREKIQWCMFFAIASIAFASFYILREYQVYHFSFANFRPEAKILGDANYFSMAAMLAFPIGFYWYLTEKRRGYRIILMIMLLPTAAGIAVSGSRGGLLALMAFMAFAAWRSRKVGQLALLVVLLIPPMLMIPRNPITRMLHPDTADKQSSLVRIETLKAGMRMALGHPLAGIGVGQFKPKLADYTGKPALAKMAHNTYLEIGAELGIPCLLVYLWLLWETWRSYERVRRAAFQWDDTLIYNFVTGLQGGLLGFLISSFFLSAEYVKFFWFYVFMSIAMERVVHEWAAARLDSDITSDDDSAQQELEIPMEPEPLPPLGHVHP
jgi:O-antigen ligase